MAGSSLLCPPRSRSVDNAACGAAAGGFAALPATPAADIKSAVQTILAEPVYAIAAWTLGRASATTWKSRPPEDEFEELCLEAMIKAKGMVGGGGSNLRPSWV